MSEKTKSYTRKCIVSNEIFDVGKLIRFNYDKKTNSITLDLNKEQTGRGAYLYLTQENLAKFRKIKALNRTFRFNVPNETYDAILKQLEEVLHEQEKQ